MTTFNLNNKARHVEAFGTRMLYEVRTMRRYAGEPALYYRGNLYYVTGGTLYGMESMCGGNSYLFELEKRTRTPRASEIRYATTRPRSMPVFEAGISIFTIEADDRAVLIRFAEVVAESLKRSENLSLVWCVARKYNRYVLSLLVHVYSEVREFWADCEDINLDTSSYLYALRGRQSISGWWPTHVSAPDEAWSSNKLSYLCYCRFSRARSHSNEEFVEEFQDILVRAAKKDNGPAVISSNLGKPSYEDTVKWMEYMMALSSSLKRKHGLTVLTPATLATNPNEGNHFIAAVIAQVGVVASGEMVSDIMTDIETASEEEYDDSYDGIW